MSDEKVALDHDAQAESEMAKATAATTDADRKLHLNRAAQHATAAELVRRQISSSE